LAKTYFIHSIMATGPITAAGKQSASRNAIKHGLRARKWLTPQEQEDHAQLIHDLLGEHQPKTATEHIMVERIAMGMTKLRRLQQVEDAMYARERYDREQATLPSSRRLPADLLADSAMPSIKVLDTLSRYQTSLDRQISKAIGELMVLKERARTVKQETSGLAPGAPKPASSSLL
jgi:hypothetical protein